MNKQEIINEIAVKHHIILDEKDPIFAVISANEKLLNEFEVKIDKILLKHKSELEGYKHTIIQELREYSSQTSEDFQNLLKNYNNQVISQKPTKEFSTSNNNDLNFTSLSFIISLQIVFLLIGIIIGLFI